MEHRPTVDHLDGRLQAEGVETALRTRAGLSRFAVVAVAATLALGGLTGCVVAEATPTATAGAPAASQAAEQLTTLTVASAGSMRGYSRSRFPHWRDTGSNCDVRDTILARDGEDIRLSGCNVVGGRWFSVYDGRNFDEPIKLDIDHMVPLANAWRSGANEWDDEKRADFANDEVRPQLIAVSLSSNRAKGDQDPAQWKPPNREFWCQYARDWILVKHYWKLSVTPAEKAALGDMLATC